MSQLSVNPASKLHVRSHRTAHWFWIDNAILDRHGPALGAIGLALYMALARYANAKTGQCYPSLGRLGRDIAVTGLITMEARPGFPSIVTLLDVPQADEGSLPGKEVAEGDINGVKEGLNDVSTSPIPSKDEPDVSQPDIMNQAPTPDGCARGEEEEATPTLPTPPLVQHPMDAIERILSTVPPTTLDHLRESARASLIAEGVSPWHVIAPTIAVRMAELWEGLSGLWDGLGGGWHQGGAGAVHRQGGLAPGRERGFRHGKQWASVNGPLVACGMVEGVGRPGPGLGNDTSQKGHGHVNHA
jgi:hypothetical protein